MVALTVVRIGKDALRRAREIALKPRRKAGTGLVGATFLRKITVKTMFCVAKFDGNGLPLSIDDQAASDQLAALAN